MSILIVDDSSDMVRSMESLLQSAGHPEVLTAASAAAAFEVLSTDAGQRVEVILMDLAMPGVDGIEACRRIKSTERLRDIPILMVTAHDDTAKLQAAFAAGAIDYITKPFHLIELLARLRSALALKRELEVRRDRERQLLEVTCALARANETLQRLATLDGLTGLANRRWFDEALLQEWARGVRDAAPLGLILLDIDHFKDFNDRHGHQRGDECLRQVALVLAQAAKRPGDLAARYGGEELALLLPRTDEAGALALAEGVRQGVLDLAIAHGARPDRGCVTVTLGVAGTTPAPGEEATLLVAAADAALYQGKRAGRNCCRAANPEPVLAI